MRATERSMNSNHDGKVATTASSAAVTVAASATATTTATATATSNSNAATAETKNRGTERVLCTRFNQNYS
jgi:hypothetical protein